MAAEKTRVLVTGGNKGVGYGIVKALLDRGCYVYLGSRSAERGEAAAKSLGSANVEVVTLDVGDQASVDAAAEAVKAKGRLDVLVNNAGVAGTGGLSYSDHAEFAHILSTNFDGLVRTTEKFLPLLSENGRIVNISSASGPMFLAKCTPERVKFFIDPTTTLEQLRSVVAEASAISSKHAPGEVPAAMAAVGLGEGAPYGLSKAAVSCYTVGLAKQYPNLAINACTPGFIETDLTRVFADAMNKTPAEMGMKSIDAGAQCPVYLALDDIPTPKGEGWFYGSDSVRSPLHAYRSPGDPPFNGVVDI